MKLRTNMRIALLIISGCTVLLFGACTKNFESYNKDPNGITDEQLQADFNSIGAFFPDIQNSVYPSNGANTISADVVEIISCGSWGGYFMVTLPGVWNPNYFLFAGWEPYSFFGVGYNSIMSPINEIKRRGAETLAPDFWAVAQILRVAGMHKVTDIYGPAPYSQFGTGGTSVAYDSQPDLYNAFFTELDGAVATLVQYVAGHPGATPFKKFDRIYNGDYTKWIRYANSLRLRLAMRIVKADPERARTEAEKSLDPSGGGVFTGSSDNAYVSGGLNTVYVSCREWRDGIAGAAIISYMNGYNDPRREKYFETSTIIPGEYVGVRVGSDIKAQADYLPFSNVSATAFSRTSPMQLMNAAEVYFLRAEGALRGWEMGGTAQDLYEDGIRASFEQWGLTAEAAAYIGDNVSMPDDYADPVTPANNIAALSDITIRWDESAGNEEKLERIITQQWIANFGSGTEAWSTFRRTGYPKLFPVVVNNSGGTISTEIQIRRMNYPGSEYVTNEAEVQKGVTLLGGPDHGGTRLWWDVAGPNF
ncbi:RagB/SusD family nutrient uptake outer membrane protein [Agriterribacter sp.]|uniref:RagB/SusD family nutrient uptake outer membrane protein n=1 Tax=Agriterribacter sp. TaxID=2821509 RepID=UPI002B92F4E5|nr:RagB/SusD family nutrient uptake outer membrane protein [Agriterribacter sp.]HRP55466.1 RagB/SusD family nutrient uptake outer membrane protein [Agriterribacter sp.]